MKRATVVLLAYVIAVGVTAGVGRAATPAPDTPADAQPLVVVRQPEVAVLASRVAYWKHRAQARARIVRKLRAAFRERLEIAGGGGLASAFLCIHGFEGSWTDPNPPYFGGVQMDSRFMAAYGGEFYRAWGTADHWPPFVQVAVAMRAYLSGRGFYPWPNTARSCGLL